MPDDNDAMMTKFIESVTPKLLEALTAQLEPLVEKQIGGLKENSQKLLDEVKDAQRERDAAAQKQTDDFTQLKTLLERGGSPAEIKKSFQPEPIQITREQARDVQLYQRAKAQAAAAGTTLQITENPS